MRQVAVSLLAAVVLVSMSSQNTVHAQEVSPTFIVGGGLGLPIDADGINNGLALRGGASLPVFQNLHAVLEGQYSKYGADDDELPSGVNRADVTLMGANIGVMLRSPATSSIGLYGQGGIGFTRAEGSASASLLGESFSVSQTETVLSFTIGGGIQVPINPSIGVALDARYSHAATEGGATKWIPITVSLVFGL